LNLSNPALYGLCVNDQCRPALLALQRLSIHETLQFNVEGHGQQKTLHDPQERKLKRVQELGLNMLTIMILTSGYSVLCLRITICVFTGVEGQKTTAGL